MYVVHTRTMYAVGKILHCTPYIVRVSTKINVYNFVMIEFEYLIYYLLDVTFLKVNITYKC